MPGLWRVPGVFPLPPLLADADRHRTRRRRHRFRHDTQRRGGADVQRGPDRRRRRSPHRRPLRSRLTGVAAESAGPTPEVIVRCGMVQVRSRLLARRSVRGNERHRPDHLVGDIIAHTSNEVERARWRTGLSSTRVLLPGLLVVMLRAPVRDGSPRQGGRRGDAPSRSTYYPRAWHSKQTRSVDDEP